MKRKIIAIVGPTASGKTSVGVALAKKFDGEIVSADSRQVFRGLDLGTGKEGEPAKSGQLSVVSCQLSVEQYRKCLRYIDNIPQWIIDVADPEEDYNLFKWLDGAKIAIEDIFSRGKLPIIVGGTGLYIQALVEGFQLKKQDTRNKIQTNSEKYLREQLEQMTIERLQDILKKIDADIFTNLADKKNQHRLIRAIERAQSGEEMTRVKPDWEVLEIAIDLPREVLNQRIDKRADDRFEQGMLKEVENLLETGVDASWLIGLGLEYRIIGLYLLMNKSKLTQLRQGYAGQVNQNSIEKLKIDELIENCKLKTENFKSFDAMNQTLKLRIHQYVKRQVTWFKRFPEIIWLKQYDDIEKKVKEFI